MPLAPARLLDTRDGTGGVIGAAGPGSTIDLDVTGVGGVPDGGVSAVVLNVTVVTPSVPGYLTVFPAGVERPVASSINFAAGEIVNNLVIAKVGDGGRIRLFNFSGETHIVADVSGWYGERNTTTGGSRFLPMSPRRLLDTRGFNGSGTAVGPDATIDVQVTGVTGVPASGATAVMLNVTAVTPTAPGYLTIFPGGSDRPLASSINFEVGAIVNNSVVAKLGSDGKIRIFNFAGHTHVVVDVVGWYGQTSVVPSGSLYQPVVPGRVLDTRDGTGGVSGPVNAESVSNVRVVDRFGVPAVGVTAVVLNITVTEPSLPGYLTVYPTGIPRPLAASSNFGAGQTVGNLVTTAVGENGSVSIYNLSGSVHVVADVVGWYGQGAPASPGARSTEDRPDDSYGYQVKVLYALPSDSAEHGYDTNGTITRSVAAFQHWLTGQTGGTNLRLDTFNGVLDVSYVRLPRTDAEFLANDIFIVNEAEKDLRSMGFNDPFKIYLMYYDGSAPSVCGNAKWPGSIGAVYVHCNPTDFGKSSTVPGYTDILMMHEVFHTLGAVPTCAPHQHRAGHVPENDDVMYAGDGFWNITDVKLDIGRDDYWGHGRTDCLDLSKSAFMTPTPAGAAPPPSWGILPP